MVLQVWGQHVDANRKELRNPRAHQASATPSTPVEGQFWWDTVNHEWMVWDGTVARRVKAADSALLGGQSSAYHLLRTNHTGQQTISTISDAVTWFATHTMNDLAVPTADVSMAAHKLTNLLNGSAAQDAVSFSQMNAAIAANAAGLTYKNPVRLATLVNDSLSGLATRDGITPIANDRVLVKAQTSNIINGIYLAAAGAWTPASDFAAGSTQAGGALVPVDEGTANGNTVWMLATDVASVGTNAQTWTQFGAGSVYTAGAGLVGTTTFDVNPGSGVAIVGDAVVVDSTVARIYRTPSTITSATADVTINHNLGQQWVDVTVIDVTTTPPSEILTGVGFTDANNCVVSFDAAPASSTYRVTVIG